MNMKQIIKEELDKYFYFGNCKNIFDEDGSCEVSIFTNVSDFVFNDENSKEISKEEFFNKVSIGNDLWNKLKDHDLLYFYYPNGLYVLYDDEEDIHYFFAKYRK